MEHGKSCVNSVSLLRQMVTQALPPLALDELHGFEAGAGDPE
jgi:hypothetical protein